MKKIIRLLSLLFIVMFSLVACSSRNTSNRVIILTENDSVQNFESKQGKLSKDNDIYKLRRILEKFSSNEKTPKDSQLVGATTYTVKFYTNDKLECIYTLYGQSLTYYPDPLEDKVKICALTRTQQQQVQQMLHKYLE